MRTGHLWMLGQALAAIGCCWWKVDRQLSATRGEQPTFLSVERTRIEAQRHHSAFAAPLPEANAPGHPSANRRY